MNLSERELFTGILIYKIELTDSFIAVVDVLATNYMFSLSFTVVPYGPIF